MPSSLSHPIGQKVVCVHARFSRAMLDVFERVPQRGQVYTINELFWAVDNDAGQMMLNVRLVEIPPIRAGWGGFALWRFRLLDDMKALNRRGRAPARIHRAG